MSTCTSMVYGETGRYPIEITIKKKMISFWTRLISGKQYKLDKIMYDCLLRKMSSPGGYESPWLLHIRKILDHCGMSYVWINQNLVTDETMRKNIIKKVEQKLQDQFIQNWREDLEKHESCSLYRKYKLNFGLEKYLIILPETNRRALTKLRTNNNRLPVITSRYKNKKGKTNTNASETLLLNQKMCKLCSIQDVGDEFHLIFKCTHEKNSENRAKYLENMRYYKKNANMYKLVELLKSEKYSILIKLSNFLKYALPIL